MSSHVEPAAPAQQHFQPPLGASPRINIHDGDNNNNDSSNKYVTGNPHMLKIASHTAYRSAARSPASILSKKASWVDTSRNVSLSPKNLSRPASAAASPVGTPIGTPRNRSPVGSPTRERSPVRRGEDGVRVFAGMLGGGGGGGEGSARKVVYEGVYSALTTTSVPPTGSLSTPAHPTADQTLFITSGHGLLSEARPIKTGDVVVVPAGTRHEFLNTGDAPLEFIAVCSGPKTSKEGRGDADGDDDEDDEEEGVLV
ncbi:uncharacterized protein BKCO1_3900053 [Diplodia corticola]|uniref:Cupin type-2 domain-containing protein n=1 Tax=Diplodia corticola TaxID=236234 RepID=A0A1J9QV86_9PEZI|nr:uncharacterized protein BKCO1_3900053 [Diplodia corticola]OJD32305.1 hypothetical protein BKCO1_3900053 [Diplodia corticola]